MRSLLVGAAMGAIPALAFFEAENPLFSAFFVVVYVVEGLLTAVIAWVLSLAATALSIRRGGGWWWTPALLGSFAGSVVGYLLFFFTQSSYLPLAQLGASTVLLGLANAPRFRSTRPRIQFVPARAAWAAATLIAVAAFITWLATVALPTALTHQPLTVEWMLLNDEERGDFARRLVTLGVVGLAIAIAISFRSLTTPRSSRRLSLVNGLLFLIGALVTSTWWLTTATGDALFFADGGSDPNPLSDQLWWVALAGWSALVAAVAVGFVRVGRDVASEPLLTQPA